MVNRKGKGKAREVVGGSVNGLEVTEEVVVAERSALLTRKLAEMEAANERHDTLIRELFHMSHFVNMLGYDPLEAKQDNSAVFQQFKADRGHDLLDQASSISAGPSKRTRRAVTEHQQVLHASAPPAPLKPKKKTKPRSGKEEIQAILTEAQKNKTKSPAKPLVTHPPESTSSTFSKTADSVPVPPAESISIVVRRKRLSAAEKNESSAICAPPPETVGVADQPCVAPISNGIATRTRVRKGTQDGVALPDDIQPRKRRKTEPVLPITPAKPSLSKANGVTLRSGATISETMHVPAQPSQATHSGNISKDPLDRRRTRSIDAASADLSPMPPIAPADKPPPPKFNIKRIKLLVRRPPSRVSHPLQRSAPSRHNSSLYNFFSSYHTLDDQDISQDAFNKSAAKDAEIYEREILFRNQGRFIPGTDVLFGTKSEESSFTTPQRTSKDVWDQVVADVTAYGRSRPKKPLGRQIATQIATKIQGYWDAQAVKKDRAKAQEEKQLRALAKATVKLVIAEWKRVVAHIREEERLKLEAEELKRGAEHLDAILDQSGYILETQQGDLSRGTARSRSVSSSASAHHLLDEVDSGDSDDENSKDREDEDESDGDREDGGSQLDESVHQDDDTVLPVDDDDDRDRDESESEDDEVGAHVLLADFPTSGVFPPRPLENDIIPETPQPYLSPEPPDDLMRDCEPSSSIDPSSPRHDSMDDTVVGDVDHTPRKIRESSPPDVAMIKPPSDVATPLPSEDASTPHDRDLTISTNRSDLISAPLTLPPAGDIKPDEVVLGNDAPRDDATEVADDDVGVPAELESDDDDAAESDIPEYLKPYAVAPVQWDPQDKIKPPPLLRGILRPYQQAGLEWLASLHTNNLNGILADEMGLGKTIQTIALLAHLACDRGIWGPHLIIVPTSVLLNWEMEFKKFLPGFKVLSYHGNTKRRKELRQGWNDKYHFNVCITSYTLASRDAHILRRKAIYYMILDEAHMIKNFKSQRWNILLGFRSFRRLLLTGTPLQNNLTELWALLQFLMSGSNFANLKEFDEWFSNPLEKMIEMGYAPDEENMQRVTKLHTVLRPYLLRRLKRDVEKELPSKYEHLVLCPLSKRQRFLYDEFMSRAHTRDALQSGVYQKIANVLMQLRKVCNHPDLFEVRPIVTSFALSRSAIADFEIQELLIRRRMAQERESLNLELLGLRFIDKQGSSILASRETQRLDATNRLPFISELPGEPPPKDTRTIAGFRAYEAWRERAATISRWAHIGYLNHLRCNSSPSLSLETLRLASRFADPLLPSPHANHQINHLENVHLINGMVKTYSQRECDSADIVRHFAFATPPVVALDMPRIAFSGHEDVIQQQDPTFDEVLHRSTVKLQIAFPDSSLLQYDCGKLQQLARLLREKKLGGHRCLIFTQMTKVLDILEIFMNLHGYLYLRLDGATKIEDRQYITERFNVDARIFCFISSSRSGGVGINLTGADTVIFYDSDFNPQMDRQCEDRAHRIGQIRDVHIYRFVSQHTVEEAMLRKANQKRSLDDLVIQKGEFDWRSLFNDEGALTQALGQVEDTEDAHAADVAAREEVDLEGADDADFGDEGDEPSSSSRSGGNQVRTEPLGPTEDGEQQVDMDGENDEDGGAVVDYMLNFVKAEYDFFKDWRL